MALIEWSREYRSGNEIVDAQHEHLFGLLNGLHDQIMGGKGGDGLLATVDKLTDYVQEHFRDEEALMESAGYHGLEEHRELHRKLIGKVVDFKDLRNSGRPIAPLELVRFLSAWIQYHILQEDLRFLCRSVKN